MNFVLVLDRDETRKRSFINRIQSTLPPVDGLSIDSLSLGEFGAAWAAGTWTPISNSIDDNGTALVFGDAISDNRRLTAEEVRKRCKGVKSAAYIDGIHIVATYDPKTGLTVRADLLGAFPVYYYATDEAILIGSSPELFKEHPSFKPELDLEGLVGILLTEGIVDGKTLLLGVKRLSAGNLLRCNLESGAVESEQFKLPMSNDYFGATLSRQIEALDRALEEAVERQVPKDEKCCLMLSGGLDSTLLAGYLNLTGHDVVALTEGLSTDNEMRCAKNVANSLGLKHIHFNLGYDNYAHYSDLSATWQHLSDGFTGVAFWGFREQLRGTAPRVITGFSGDGILGTMVDWSLNNRNQTSSFETLFDSINRRAFRPDLLRRLLREKYADDLVSRTLKRIRTIHSGYPGREFQKTWGFGLSYRIRFHDLSGIWPLSFGAWPILPFCDHKILETVGGFPIESLRNRKVERELLRIKFPKLARLALAGATPSPVPIEPNPRNEVKQRIFGMKGIWKLKTLREMRDHLLIRLKGENRYWPRKSHFDSPGWRIIRKIAEPNVDLITRFLDKETLKTILPSADSRYFWVPRKMKHAGIVDTASLKTILGFVFWSKNHPNALSNSAFDRAQQ